LKNNYLYQGSFAELDEDIGWNDFALRNYDAQIGRWVQQDPYQEFATPYVYVGNDPINLTDPTGGFSWPPNGMANLVSKTTETAGKVLASQAGNVVSLLTKSGVFANIAAKAINIISTAEVGNRQDDDFRIARSTNRLNQEDMKENDGDPDKWGSIGRMFAKNEEFALDKVNDLINIGTKDAGEEMKEVAKEMFNQFRTKKGGVYYSEKLNKEIKNDYRYKDMIEKFSKRFEKKITSLKGDINKLRNVPEKIDITDIVPVFHDNTTGLGITVDGINYTVITISKFKINPDKTYTATIKVRMYDSFGLDTQDILDLLNHPNIILRKALVSNFIAWWILQHVKGFKHLDVKIENTETISGSLK
jgi:RHS repeat-associated protein